MQKLSHNDLRIGFSISATYAAATLRLWHDGYDIDAVIAFISCLICFGLTYLLIYRPGKWIGRAALLSTLVPLWFTPIFLLYPVYKFGRCCLSPHLENEAGDKQAIHIWKDTLAFAPLFLAGALPLILNPDYLFILNRLSKPDATYLYASLFLLGLIGMSFLAAARLRQGGMGFQKITAYCFSGLFSIAAAFILLLAPAAVTMSEQMPALHQSHTLPE